jgi:hypothetical protein
MANGYAIGVVAATGRVREGVVGKPGARAQLQRPIMIDRSINVAVGQKGRNVMPKATISFGLGGLRILLARLGNQRRIYGRVKPLGGMSPTVSRWTPILA